MVIVPKKAALVGWNNVLCNNSEVTILAIEHWMCVGFDSPRLLRQGVVMRFLTKVML